jgi:hypothetical protein
LAESRWEGTRYWNAFYRHDKSHQCEKNARNAQPVSIDIDRYGRITTYAHVITLPVVNDDDDDGKQRAIDADVDQRRYLLGMLYCCCCCDYCACLSVVDEIR